MLSEAVALALSTAEAVALALSTAEAVALALYSTTPSTLFRVSTFSKYFCWHAGKTVCIAGCDQGCVPALATGC